MVSATRSRRPPCGKPEAEGELVGSGRQINSLHSLCFSFAAPRHLLLSQHFSSPVLGLIFTPSQQPLWGIPPQSHMQWQSEFLHLPYIPYIQLITPLFFPHVLVDYVLGLRHHARCWDTMATGTVPSSRIFQSSDILVCGDRGLQESHPYFKVLSLESCFEWWRGAGHLCEVCHQLTMTTVSTSLEHMHIGFWSFRNEPFATPNLLPR